MTNPLSIYSNITKLGFITTLYGNDFALPIRMVLKCKERLYPSIFLVLINLFWFYEVIESLLLTSTYTNYQRTNIIHIHNLFIIHFSLFLTYFHLLYDYFIILAMRITQMIYLLLLTN